MPKKISFFDSNNGLLNTGSWWSGDSELLQTSDGGKSWQRKLWSGSNLLSYSFINKDIGWVVGGRNVLIGDLEVYKTTNSGSTWDKTEVWWNEYGARIYFVDELTGWITNGTRMRFTSDGGNTWVSQNCNGGNSIHFSTKTNGWAVGYGGSIYRYDTNKFLSLTSPVGNEHFSTTYNLPIKWQFNWVEKVRLDYTINEGITWVNLARNYPANDSTFNWRLNASLSSHCLVRIMDESDSSMFDISNPFFIDPVEVEENNSTLLSFLPFEDLRRIAISDKYAFITSEEKGFYVFNISNPKNPFFVTRFQTEGWAASTKYIDEKLYVAERSAGLTIYDVHDSKNIYLLGKFAISGSALEVIIVDSIAFVSDYYYGLRILNVKTPNEIYEISSIKGSSTFFVDYPFVYRIKVDLYPYVLKLEIIDVSNLSSPLIISSIDLPPASGEIYNITANQNLVLLGLESGLVSIDVSDKFNPKQITTFSPDDIYIINKMIISNKIAYVANRWYGLDLLTNIDLPNIERVGYLHRKKQINFFSPGYFNDFIKKGSLVYLVDRFDGLYIINCFPKTVPAQDQKNTIPVNFSLSQNFPNPFNPSTVINYSLPKQTFVNITIYNSLGGEIELLVNQEKQAGSYAVQYDASGVSSGVYFYAIKTSEYVQVKKMLFVK